MTNSEHNHGSRICVIWRDSVCMTLVYKSDQLITCSVALQGEEEFFCTFMYASNLVEGRKELWEDLCYHHNSPLFKKHGWLWKTSTRYLKGMSIYDSYIWFGCQMECQTFRGWCFTVDSLMTWDIKDLYIHGAVKERKVSSVKSWIWCWWMMWLCVGSQSLTLCSKRNKKIIKIGYNL